MIRTAQRPGLSWRSATYRLFAIVGAATAAAYFGLVFASVPFLQKPSLPRLVQVPMQASAV